jgi:Fic family protein
MHTKYSPCYHITPRIARDLMRIEALKERILNHLPTPELCVPFSQAARLIKAHYSTLIEGNRLDPLKINLIINEAKQFPGYEEDEISFKRYLKALSKIDEWISAPVPINEKMIQCLYELAMGCQLPPGKTLGYREEQNVVFNTRTKAIVYMPPEAKEVPALVKGLVNWIKENEELPCPIIAAIANYQLTSIHPYYAGNGRIARLLATLILGLGKYDLKGLYSIEEFYVNNLNAYYEALSMAPLHNYYKGREESDITPWIQYFIEGMVFSFENVLKKVSSMNQEESKQEWQATLDAKQLKAISFFQEFATIKASTIK